MSEIVRYEPGEIREKLTERFVAVVREWIGEVGIIAGNDALSINHFLEMTDVKLPYNELDKIGQEEVRDVLKSPQVVQFIEEEGFEIFDQIEQSGRGVDILIRRKETVSAPEGEKKVLIVFENECMECHNPVVVPEYVPESMAGKWKVSKVKRFRDWDKGLVPCPHCELAGAHAPEGILSAWVDVEQVVHPKDAEHPINKWRLDDGQFDRSLNLQEVRSES